MDGVAACRHGNQGDRISAGVGMMKVRHKNSNAISGGWAAEVCPCPSCAHYLRTFCGMARARYLCQNHVKEGCIVNAILKRSLSYCCIMPCVEES